MICTHTGCLADLPTMKLNNVINSIIVYRSKYCSCTEKIVFFKITALHSCQLELRPKPLYVALQKCKKNETFR